MRMWSLPSLYLLLDTDTEHKVWSPSYLYTVVDLQMGGIKSTEEGLSDNAIAWGIASHGVDA